MLADWEKEYPGRTESIFSSLRNVETAHLADPRRFDFSGLDAEPDDLALAAGREQQRCLCSLSLERGHCRIERDRIDCNRLDLPTLIRAEQRTTCAVIELLGAGCRNRRQYYQAGQLEPGRNQIHYSFPRR